MFPLVSVAVIRMRFSPSNQLDYRSKDVASTETVASYIIHSDFVNTIVISDTALNSKLSRQPRVRRATQANG